MQTTPRRTLRSASSWDWLREGRGGTRGSTAQGSGRGIWRPKDLGVAGRGSRRESGEKQSQGWSGMEGKERDVKRN